MYVLPGHRCRGIGGRLVDAAVTVARERRWFRLDVTGPEDEGAERAVDFYRHRGFEFTGPKLRRLL